jgi:hypothetical protein
MSSSTTIIRQKSGRPEGGQFAGIDRPDADISLSDVTSADTKPARKNLTDAELLAQSRVLARVAASKAGLNRWDAEDVAQDVVMSVLYTQSRTNEPIEGGLLRHAARALVSRRMDTHQNHTDSTAYAQWKRDVEQMEAESGRHLTAAELDAYADEVRERWYDPRHRPTRGFQHETKVVSTDAMGATFVHPTADVYKAEGSDKAHTIADQIESGEIDKADARRRLWNVLADDKGVPEAIEGSVTESRARRFVKDVPDAYATATAFLDGEINSVAGKDQLTAFFAPFGTDLSLQEKTAVAKLISSRPKVGHQLWRSAIDFSNARYGK